MPDPNAALHFRRAVPRVRNVWKLISQAGDILRRFLGDPGRASCGNNYKSAGLVCCLTRITLVIAYKASKGNVIISEPVTGVKVINPGLRGF